MPDFLMMEKRWGSHPHGVFTGELNGELNYLHAHRNYCLYKSLPGSLLPRATSNGLQGKPTLDPLIRAFTPTCSTLESNPKHLTFIARLKVFHVCNSISFPRNEMTLTQTWLLNQILLKDVPYKVFH